MNAYSESTYLGDVLKCEAPNLYSRETVIVLTGDGAERALKVGAAIARRTQSTVTVTAGDSNTGDGAATMADPALGARAEAGIYRLACITAGAAGIVAYDVTAPDGADAEVTAILRDAILADRAIVWPDGINEAAKAAAIADLEARGIVVRKAA